MRDVRESVLDAALFRTAVQAAILAPSMHNYQPWRFRHADAGLEVSADPARQLTVADPRGWAARLACGAAAANASLALAAEGVPNRVELSPDPARPYLMARVVPTGSGPATPQQWELARAIPRRHSNRHPFSDVAVPAQARAALRATALEHGAWLELLVGRQPLELVAEIVRAADRTLRQEPEYVAELAALSTGAPPAGTGVPEYVAGIAPAPEDLLAMRDFGGTPRGRFVDFEADPLVAVLGTTGDTGYDQLVAGVALEYVLLTATVHDLAVSMLSQPIEVPAARNQLRRGLGRTGMPQLLLRIGYGQPAFASPRLPVESVIES